MIILTEFRRDCNLKQQEKHFTILVENEITPRLDAMMDHVRKV